VERSRQPAQVAGSLSLVEPSGRPPAALPSCPLLGLPRDPRTHYSFTNDQHRCHATGKPASIRLTHQAEFCLTSEFDRCPLYRGWRSSGSRAPVPLTPATLQPRGRPSSRRGLGLLAVAVVALFAVFGLSLLSGRQNAAVQSATAPPLVSHPPASSASPVSGGGATPAATATVPPSAGSPPTAAPPTVAPPAAPPPAAAPPTPAPRVHIVLPGESLTAIAARFDTTVERLLELNDIDDPDVIEIGAAIVIPASR
jgi:LysM repeat protein